MTRKDRHMMLQAWQAKLEARAPKWGAFLLILIMALMPLLTGQGLLSHTGATIMLIAASGLFFAATWNEWKEL